MLVVTDFINCTVASNPVTQNNILNTINIVDVDAVRVKVTVVNIILNFNS